MNTLYGNVIIIDDDEAIRRTLNILLTGAGYQVTEAFSGFQAVEFVQQRIDIDVVLLDLRMPGLSGLDTLKLIRKASYREVYIIILTAASEYETFLLDSGADDYILKPYTADTLLARVRAGIRAVSRVREWIAAEAEAYDDTVQRLLHAAEFRDPETGNHLQRMAQYSYLMANAIDMLPKESECLLRAAPLHDIGKIAIPDSILLKPSSLTPEEFEIMQRHTTHGFRILSESNSPLLMMGAEIAYSHHEKWDGSGYPQGLSDTDIPLVGRIVAIADVFDALTSNRPYKKAWSIDDAYEFMWSQRGVHFDPKLIDVFCDMRSQVVETRMRFSSDGVADESASA